MRKPLQALGEMSLVDVGSHRVLVVDDEYVIADTLRAIFSAAGYETRPAYSAEQAVEIIAEWQPDLAILDVVLPVMNGIDLAILLKAQYPSCGILLFSGQAATAELLELAMKKGYNFEILAKPVHPDVLLESALKLLTANQANQVSEATAAQETAVAVLPAPEVEEPPMS